MENDRLNEQVCCPRFNPEPWDNQYFTWDKKRFIKDKVNTLFFMPLNFGKVMVRLDKRMKEAVAVCPENMCLSDHTSNWNMDLYLATNKEVPNSENVLLSGKYYTRAYEGTFSETGKWCKDFGNEVIARGETIKREYFWYTTCPKCAKKYGKNYVVIVAEIG